MQPGSGRISSEILHVECIYVKLFDNTYNATRSNYFGRYPSARRRSCKGLSEPLSKLRASPCLLHSMLQVVGFDTFACRLDVSDSRLIASRDFYGSWCRCLRQLPSVQRSCHLRRPCGSTSSYRFCLGLRCSRQASPQTAHAGSELQPLEIALALRATRLQRSGLPESTPQTDGELARHNGPPCARAEAPIREPTPSRRFIDMELGSRYDPA